MSFFNTKLSFAVSFALFAITSPHTAIAQSDDMNCSDPQTQIEMNICSGMELEAADVELNAIWPLARKTNDAYAEYLPEERKSDVKSLLKAQRAWITFRDAHCTSVALPNTGGSIYALIYNNCREDLTRQRTKQLRELVEGSG